LILSIESSCDDSSIAVTDVTTKEVLFHKKISQELEHSSYGGVVPELAARLHATALPAILEQTREFFPSLKAVAVTSEPGLSVTLVEGITMAKALSISLKIPLIAVNHLYGHIYSLFIEREDFFPHLSLLVSGGHTMVMRVGGYEKFEILAKSMDDSFGESFDKVAKMIGLGYPGGPIVEKMAKEGDEDRFDFTIPLKNSSLIAFSYSGLKNQVRLAIKELKDEITHQDKCDICASFQKTATAHLIQKTKKIFKNSSIKDLSIVGGASANLYLRDKFEKLCEEFGVRLHLTPLKYCSDNAVMIGRYAIEAYMRGDFNSLEGLDPKPKLYR
jgi:N6-L-threonylcarbamoyladenine synthase